MLSYHFLSSLFGVTFSWGPYMTPILTWVFWLLSSTHSVWPISSSLFTSTTIVFNFAFNFSFVGISWVQNIFSWVFRGFKSFSCGYFVDPKFFLVGSKFSFADNFVIFSCCPREKKRHRDVSETVYSFPNQFQHLWILFILERHFIY